MAAMAITTSPPVWASTPARRGPQRWDFRRRGYSATIDPLLGGDGDMRHGWGPHQPSLGTGSVNPRRIFMAVFQQFINRLSA
jgi:hypothetical protein